MKQRITLLLTILFVGVVAIAQQPRQRKGPEEFKKEYQQFIAKQAKLTAEEAAAFFPIYNECQEKKNKLNGQIWKLRRDTYNKELTEKDYQRILEEIAKLRIQIEELEKTYLPLYHKVISYKKIFEVQGAEARFHRELLKSVNHPNKNKKDKK